MPYQIAAIVGAVVVAVAFVVLAAVLRRRGVGCFAEPVAVVPLAALIHLAAFAGFYAWFIGTVQPEWYFGTTLASTAMLLAWICSHKQAAHKWVPAAMLAILLAANATTIAVHPMLYSHQATQLRAATELLDRTPPDATLGAWNAGILSAFGQRHVVNIDGLVSPSAHAQSRQATMGEHVREKRIGYICDWASMR